MAEPGPRVGLLVTCLVDLLRPEVGFAAVKLLEAAGCTVEVPLGQTCCGQPAYNSGDRADAAAIARAVIEIFEPYDHVVVPSGSCAGMVVKHYPALLAGGPWEDRAVRLGAKTHELTSYLVDIRGFAGLGAAFAGTVTYHDSCSSLRELAVRDQPRRLLAAVSGLRLEEMATTEACCGFGGTFCVKYPDISDAMVTAKAGEIAATGADTVLAGDLGCLLNIAGKLARQGRATRVRHVAEVLAGMADGAAIGEPADR